jgi:hypothetical protein
MFSTPILDVAIGLSFLYLLLGLISSNVTEMIAGWRKTRAKFLDKGIDRLLAGDSQLKALLYKHPLISALAPSDRQICPSYIPAQKFATALLDILSKDKPLTDTSAVMQGVTTTGNPALQTALKALIDSSGEDGVALQKQVENWFNDGMDRVTGWYKKNAQFNSVIMACAITLVMNVDTVKVANTLWENPTVRAELVDGARARAQKSPEESLPMVKYENPNDATESTPINVPASPEEGLSPNEKNLLGQLTGWGPDWKKLAAASGFGAGLLAALGLIYAHGIGWIVSALAISLGAPFWFDTLNRFMNIRNAGRAPDEPRDKSQPSPKPAA